MPFCRRLRNSHIKTNIDKVIPIKVIIIMIPNWSKLRDLFFQTFGSGSSISVSIISYFIFSRTPVSLSHITSFSNATLNDIDIGSILR